jgi:hypothetical protein
MLEGLNRKELSVIFSKDIFKEQRSAKKPL